MTDSDNLTDLRGVGPAIAENLRAAGFDSADAVMEAEPEDLADVELIGEESAQAIQTRGTEGNSRGQPPSVEEHIDDIRPHLKKPISDRAAIAQSPIARSTHKEWLRKDGEPYEAYQRMYEEARAEAEEQLVNDGLYADADSSLVKFLLKATHGYRDEQTVRHEGDADLGGETTVVLDSDYVDSE